jgi:hypothetical protein
MSKSKRSMPAHQEKMHAGDMRPIPESRARRERLELKGAQVDGATFEGSAGKPIVMGGSMSDRATTSRVGRQPVLESPMEHPAARGPRMPRSEVQAEEAAAAALKPGAARMRSESDMPADDEEE